MSEVLVNYVDREVAPTPIETEAIFKALGNQPYGWLAYIGGAECLSESVSGWTPELVGELSHYCATLPIYVPLQSAQANAFTDADNAVELLQTFGYKIGTPLVLDLESNWTGSIEELNTYLTTFTTGVKSNGYRVIPYLTAGQLTTLAKLANSEPMPSRVYVASWLPDGSETPISVENIPSLANDVWFCPGQRAWQWQGNVEFGGINVDRSLVPSEVNDLIQR